jgi:DNA modification methylase
MIKSFKNKIKSFREFGSLTQTTLRDFNGLQLPVYENEFWTSKQRDGHSIHEISYRACYKPELPKFFINALSNPGDIIYDPFLGRGTTIVQALPNDFGNPKNKIFCELADNTKSIDDNTVHLTVTSPPFMDIVDYVQV